MFTLGSGLINGIWGLGSGIFGGRSGEQIAADEYASAQFHLGVAQKQGYSLTINEVAGVLRAGWNNGEDGAQLGLRFQNYLNTLPTPTSFFGGLGLGLGGGGASGAGSGGGGGAAGMFSNPIVIIVLVIAVIAFVVLRR